MKIRNNDLTHYFLRPHNQLPQGYLDHCQEFFNSLKLQASSGKPQAASFKRQASKNNCINQGPVLKIDSTERYNYENKRSIKNNRLIYKNKQDAWLELQLASMGMSNWFEA
jgi:aspartyl aminopeptidase